MEKRAFATDVCIEMEKTKAALEILKLDEPDLDYYLDRIKTIEENIELAPDIAIETCKSLVEGISKYVWAKVEPNAKVEDMDKLDFQPLYKKSIEAMARKCDFLEPDFVTRSGSLFHILGEIRNRRGDISHGRLAPKAEFSNASFAHLAIQMTDNILCHVLQCYGTIPFEKTLAYEENPALNQYLDELNPLIGVSYSKALFDQEIETYKQELRNFTDNQLA